MSQPQFSHKYYKTLTVLDKGFLISYVFWNVMSCILTHNYQAFQRKLSPPPSCFCPQFPGDGILNIVGTLKEIISFL